MSDKYPFRILCKVVRNSLHVHTFTYPFTLLKSGVQRVCSHVNKLWIVCVFSVSACA
jgi:hypothetical protein